MDRLIYMRCGRSFIPGVIACMDILNKPLAVHSLFKTRAPALTMGLIFHFFQFQFIQIIIAAVGSTLFLTTDFDVMTRASFLDRVITMQLDSKYRRNLVFCQSVIARKSP